MTWHCFLWAWTLRLRDMSFWEHTAPRTSVLSLYDLTIAAHNHYRLQFFPQVPLKACCCLKSCLGITRSHNGHDPNRGQGTTCLLENISKLESVNLKYWASYLIFVKFIEPALPGLTKEFRIQCSNVTTCSLGMRAKGWK